MNPKAIELQARTQKFAKAVIEFCERLPRNAAAQKIADQLLDSAGSTDSNYRATCRARSPDEFISKIGVAAEEADESASWLDLIAEAKLVRCDLLARLQKEGHELEAIFSSSAGTARRNERSRRT